MITAFDSADKAIEKTITDLCKKLSYIKPDDADFLPTVEAISKLRASMNPQIIQKSE